MDVWWHIILALSMLILLCRGIIISGLFHIIIIITMQEQQQPRLIYSQSKAGNVAHHLFIVSEGWLHISTTYSSPFDTFLKFSRIYWAIKTNVVCHCQQIKLFQRNCHLIADFIIPELMTKSHKSPSLNITTNCIIELTPLPLKDLLS